MYEQNRVPTREKVDKFAYLSPMLDSALSEMRDFSKKKQDGIVSATKIKILNRLLADIREILSGEDSGNYLDPLDEQQLAQNSDAVLVLGQYRAALNSFEKAHFRYVSSVGNVWITKEWIEEREAQDRGGA